MPRLDSRGIQVEVDPQVAQEVRLVLPAIPENVAVVRQAMTGMIEALGLGPGVLADMKTAVSEACNNVVVHAYDETRADRPVMVKVTARGRDVAVTVRDRGRGITDDESNLEADRDGVGLSLISALTAGVQIEGAPGRGTEVHMQFVAEDDDHLGLPDDAPPPIGQMLASVLGRTIAMVAARANFSLDRLSDAQLVSDAVAAHAPAHAAAKALRVEVDESERALALRVGPLEREGGRNVVRASDLPGVGLLLEQLADDVAIEGDGDDEMLVLRIDER